MMEEEQKEKYANFLDKVSEILGLNRSVDILRLCAVTDEYLKPIEKRIAELEKENAELKETVTKMNNVITKTFSNLTKAKELLNEFMRISKASDEDFEHDYSELIGQTETFLQGVNYV